ncbi:TonB-dependent receptor domain-containing protein [Dyadobacter psychrotolerans]|uniref:TonB-dependent receptor n=1 Tax=Dyadobacter psychrotolerans TaxID=2541721 RepID=A0A4R5DZ45_9BACT|nr:TonB-dependent receptor [Dyadobacter psychrotolerans]TDE16483.1 TonB-dependent receptor [Dyadobacter psychrotolerans]
MKILIYFTVALLLSGSFVYAQTTSTGKVSGTVLDEKSEIFPFVNVLLLNAKDSTLAKGLVSDDKGKFIFEQVAAGRYLTLVSMVGYQKEYSKVFTVEIGLISLPETKLRQEEKALNEITVTAKKPFIEQQIDRTVINVENSIVSAGSTALEVLERSPGVTVDQQNDKLQLRGKDGVIVQIDGKQTFLSQAELVNLLRNTPSDNIEKIELITNPSSKYDAAGNSGIINIKFKRNKNFGTNGNVTLGGGIASRGYGRGNGSVSINHREGKLSLFATGSGFKGEGFNENKIVRKVEYEGVTTKFDQISSSDWHSSNYSYRAGLDYFLTKKTTIGALVSGFYNKWSNPLRNTDTRILNGDESLRQTYHTGMQGSNRMNNITANINLKHQFDDKGKELTVDADYVQYDSKGFNGLDTRYYKADGSVDGNPEIIRNNMPALINIGVAKMDYTQPVGKGKFEAGLKASYVLSDNNMTFETFADDWQIDPSRTNRFKYTENINAAYANYNGQFNSKTKFQLGLRAEHTHAIGNSVTLNDKRDRNYINVFPSVFLSRNLDSSNVLNLSYSYRIDRPTYQSLNPFEYYLDPYTFEKGNPYLKPQYTHSFQLVHVYKNFLNTTLAYSRTKDMIVSQIPQLIAEKNVTYLTTDNLDSQNYLSLTISAPIAVTKWWNLQTNLIATLNQYKTYYRNASYDVDQFSYNVSATNSFTLPKNWTVELSGWYNSKAIYGLLVVHPQGMLNLGIQKSLMAKKATVRLNVQDLFWTNKFTGTTQFEDIDLSVKSMWPSRQVRMTFTYRFGNQNVKGARQRNTGSDDIQKRVNSGN